MEGVGGEGGGADSCSGAYANMRGYIRRHHNLLMLVTVPLFHLLLLIFRHTFITHSNLCAIIRSI